jgi:hypothetical protein
MYGTLDGYSVGLALGAPSGDVDMKLERLGAAIVVVVLLVLAFGTASVAEQARGKQIGVPVGNSANAKLCQHGGYQSWVRADQAPFVNVGDCVSYAAHGGILTTPTSGAQTRCESYGGTFGNTILTFGSWPTILWTCNGWSWVSEVDLQAKYGSLGTACLAGDGTGYALRGVDAALIAHFTCGKA